MAQPLAKVPPFSLLLYGSDNKYSAEDVKKRWLYVKAELNKLNIKVLTISSDSDPKYNSAMRNLSMLGCKINDFPNNDYFACGDRLNCDGGTYYVQDLIHIATKLRNFFLKTMYNKNKIRFISCSRDEVH